jgi:hypothetical protein
MPTNPEPVSLYEIVKRAVEVADPDGADERLDQLLGQFEDDDEPVAGVLDDLESRLADVVSFVDADIEDPAVSMATVMILYLAHRRDELHAAPDRIMRLAARSEWEGDPPHVVVRWLADRGVKL